MWLATARRGYPPATQRLRASPLRDHQKMPTQPPASFSYRGAAAIRPFSRTDGASSPASPPAGAWTALASASCTIGRQAAMPRTGPHAGPPGFLPPYPVSRPLRT